MKSTGTIEAVGAATVTGKPDSARLYFGIVTQNKALVAATEINGCAVAKIQAAILAMKLSDLKAKTRDLDVSALHDEKDKNKLVGYEVRHVFSVLIFEPDPEKLGTVAAKIYDVAIQKTAPIRGATSSFLKQMTRNCNDWQRPRPLKMRLRMPKPMPRVRNSEPQALHRSAKMKTGGPGAGFASRI